MRIVAAVAIAVLLVSIIVVVVATQSKRADKVAVNGSGKCISPTPVRSILAVSGQVVDFGAPGLKAVTVAADGRNLTVSFVLSRSLPPIPYANSANSEEFNYSVGLFQTRRPTEADHLYEIAADGTVSSGWNESKVVTVRDGTVIGPGSIQAMGDQVTVIVPLSELPRLGPTFWLSGLAMVTGAPGTSSAVSSTNTCGIVPFTPVGIASAVPDGRRPQDAPVAVGPSDAAAGTTTLHTSATPAGVSPVSTLPLPRATAADSPSSPIGSPTAGPSGRLYRVTATAVIRRGASQSTAKIGTVPAGWMVGVQCKISGDTIIGPYGPDAWWDSVSYTNTSGFVADEYVDTKGDESDPTKVPLC